MKWYQSVIYIILIIITLLGSGYLWWRIYEGPSDDSTALLQKIQSREMVIHNRDKEIKLLRDSIRRTDSMSSVNTKYRIDAEAQTKLYRDRYESLRFLRKSQNVDTLHVIMGLCDSTVLNQDTLINRLRIEDNNHMIALKQSKQLIDSLDKQIVDLSSIKSLTEDELRKNKRKEKWKKIWRTARTVGIGVICFIIGSA